MKCGAAHHFLALPDPLAGEATGADGEERGADVAGDGLADERLARARRAEQQQALGGCAGTLGKMGGTRGRLGVRAAGSQSHKVAAVWEGAGHTGIVDPSSRR